METVAHLVNTMKMLNHFCYVLLAPDNSFLNEPVLKGQVEKLNRQNTEHSQGKAESGHQTDESRSGGRRQEQAELILDGPDTSTTVQLEEKKEATKEENEGGEEVEDRDIFEDSESEEEPEDGKFADDGKKKGKEEEKEAPKSETSQSVISDICKTSALPVERYFWQLIFIPLRCQESKPCSGKGRKTDVY